MRGHPSTPLEAFDYRCLNGHIFAAPPNEQGIPWATLVCPVCGATGLRHFKDNDG